MELFKAHDQWANRPPDERFWNVRELFNATGEYRRVAKQASVAYKDLRVGVDPDDDLMLVGASGGKSHLSSWATGQLCGRIGAPPSYIKMLPANLAAQNLNHGLAARAAKKPDEDDVAKVLFHSREDGSLLARAFTSDNYTRVWNNDIAARLEKFEEEGWFTPPARAIEGDPRARIATDADIPDCTYVKAGELIGPAGVYASNHDMFVFLVDRERSIFDDEALFRGFFVWNSEVGAKSFGITGFLFKGSCGNHIVWGAKGVFEIRIRHVGEANERVFDQIHMEVRKFADSSASETRALIERARNFVIPGKTKDEVIEELFGMVRKARIALPKHVLADAYDNAEKRDDFGDPNTIWGVSQGITLLSQEKQFADERTALDQEAGKLLEISF